MPKRITNHSVVVYRAGTRHTIKPNTLFDFTDSELADIKRSAADAVRQPTPENAITEVKLPTDPAPAPQASGKGNGRGGNKQQPQAAEQTPASGESKDPAAGDDEI